MSANPHPHPFCHSFSYSCVRVSSLVSRVWYYTHKGAHLFLETGRHSENSYGFCNPCPSAPSLPPLPLFLNLHASGTAEDLRVWQQLFWTVLKLILGLGLVTERHTLDRMKLWVLGEESNYAVERVSEQVSEWRTGQVVEWVHKWLRDCLSNWLPD